MSIGTWNIKTLTNKEEELVEEMKKHNVKILGISEIKKRGSGEIALKDEYTLTYSGITTERAKQGVGIVTSKEIEAKILDWAPINSRIMTLTIHLERKIRLI